MTGWNQITWDTARAGGFVAYLLLTATVALGLVLSARRQSSRWPRAVTNEVHDTVSLLALVFVGVHVLAVAVDPFTRFGIGEVLVPLVSHYRPLWMGLGIVALYLLLAVWASTKLRRRLRYSLWRRLHMLAFAVYAAATIHGLGTGSDTRTVWGAALYLGSVGLVVVLLGARLLVPVGRDRVRRPLLASGVVASALAAGMWAASGPLAPHWGARAGGSRRDQTRLRAAPAAQPVVQRPLGGAVHAPFSTRFAGRLAVGSVDGAGRVTVRIDGALRGTTSDHLEILLRGVPLDGGGVAMEQSRVRMGRETPLYQGEIVELRGGRMVALVRSPRQSLRLFIDLQLASDGRVAGVVRGSSAGGG